MSVHRLSAQHGRHHGLLVKVGAWWSPERVASELKFALTQAPACSAFLHKVLVQERVTGGWEVTVLCQDSGDEPASPATEGILRPLRLPTHRRPVESLLPTPAVQAAQAETQRRIERDAKAATRQLEADVQEAMWKLMEPTLPPS